MSLVDTYSNNIKRKKDEISRLKKDKMRYVNIVSNCDTKINRVKKQLTNTKSISSIRTKNNEIAREEKKKIDAQKNVDKSDSKIIKKEAELNKEEAKLAKEQEKIDKVQTKMYKESIRTISDDVESQKNAQLELKAEVMKLKASKEKINILFIGSNPELNLNLEKEAREIRESINKSLNRDSINFETRWAARTTDLFQFINEVNPTIIHFSGHGSEEGELFFQDNNDNYKSVSRETIIEMIVASTDDVRLVVFNNCYSSIIAEGVVKECEAAIGMNIAIGDDVAIQFASQLYSSIGFGLSLEKAFNQAVISLKLENIKEDTTPQLFVNENLRASDIYLVKGEKRY